MKTKLETSIEISHGNGQTNLSIEELHLEGSVIPQLVIDITANNNLVNKIEIKMTPERLRKIGEFLIECSEQCEKTYNNPDNTAWAGVVNSKFYVRNSQGNQID